MRYAFGLIGHHDSATRDYKLVSVHTVIRHGDRHSMHTIKTYNRTKMKCKIDIEVTHHMSVMKLYKAHMATQQQKRKPEQTFAGYEVFPDHALCKHSQLTPVGAAQHVRNGLLFRGRYLKPLGLESKDDLYKHVMVRSSPWSRTYQSALALIYGFFGEIDVALLNIESAKDCRLCRDTKETSCACPVLSGDDVDRMPATYRQGFSDVMDKEKVSQVSEHIAEVNRKSRMV